MTEVNQNSLQKSALQLKREKTKNKKKNKIQKFEMPTIILPTDEKPVEKSQEVEDNGELDDFYQEILKKFDQKTAPQPETEEKAEEEDNKEEEEDIEVSGRKIRKYGRPTVAMLKQDSRRPELVEPSDTNSPDPFTLIEIKNARNVVPVPSHWSQKRKYLNYKKGSEISKYRLPPYLEKTNIPQMRQALLDMDEKKSLASKQRERARPKMGMFDVKPEVLYSAFFHQQTKPVMTRYGDIYYEYRETLPNTRGMRVGYLSQTLRDALGMSEKSPPPYLFNMQRFGPPPSYPNLKIPGLNAPLPKGCRYGSGTNGWGQVPIQDGKPLFGGNPFGNPDEIEDLEGAELWGKVHVAEGIEDGVNI
ncbi:PSP family protein [Trichomonas vaginalis G3]|uniref:PSP family protein n=1 Tax=Trichomonas vaginalis (strain ATCC PRA-98 / G3) TaxID=412133 RepID=A2E6X1_TRIV3|nr:mRNA splicing, via spliceosome [Trichomonas vaginalis G3]EAY11607.1 PSP family protein [Trichomonas vaginalis G3]KAI5516510.1 mRNA splicing, via spliceosome [Trichomonas vaginalis G3]|eukprot:XP_001323830.1 PSP family protein [Trichomonas vaginalis G3]